MSHVLDSQNRRVNLTNEGNALDAKVLDALRKALVKNDFYVRLTLTGNHLDDDCIAVVCAILKDPNYIQVIDLDNCAISDRDLQYYIIPAILSRNHLKTLNLSKNKSITDASAAAVGTLIREGSLTTLQMGGTGLTKKSGDVLLNDLESNSCLEVLDLPYSIGFKVLDKVKSYLEASKLKKKMLADAGATKSPSNEMNSPVDTATPPSAGVTPHGQKGTTTNTTSTPPSNEKSRDLVLTGGPGVEKDKTAANARAEPLRTAGGAPSRDWLDPAINRTLASLSYMEQDDAFRRTAQKTRSQK